MALLSYPRRRRILAAALVPRALRRALQIGGSEPWLSTGFDTAASLALLQPWISGTGMDPAIDSRMCAHTSVIRRAQAATQVAQARASAMSAYSGPRAACHVQPTSCKPKRATVGRVLPRTRRPRFFVSRACRRRSDADCNGLSNACLRQMAELIHALFVRAGGGMFDGRGRALAQTSRRKQSHRSTSLCRLQCSYMRRRTRSSRSSRCSRSKCVFPLVATAREQCRWGVHATMRLGCNAACGCRPGCVASVSHGLWSG